MLFPPPGDLPNPGIKPAFPVSLSLQVDSSPAEPLGKSLHIYMESRKMVLVNLFAGQEQSAHVESRLVDIGSEEEGAERAERAALPYIHHYVLRCETELAGSCCLAQEAQLSATC